MFCLCSYEYNVLGALTKIIDAQGNIKRLQYDAIGRKTWMDDPDKGVMHYEYDWAGNLTKTLDNKGQEIFFTYDGANRLLGEKWGASATENTITYHYDQSHSDYPDATNLKGQVSWVEDQSGASLFSYDRKGNAVWQVKRIRPADPALHQTDYRIARQYDALNRVTRLIWPDGDSVDYLYDEGGRLKAIPGILEEARYDATGAPLFKRLSNQTVTQYEFDPRNRLTALRSVNPRAERFQDLSYQYDAVNNIVAIQDGRSLTTSAPQRANQSFQYDSLSRLTQAAGVYGKINYRYDAIGNMVEKSTPAEGSSGYVADPLIRLGAIQYGGDAGAHNRIGKGSAAGPHAVTATASGLHYKYDANGNMIEHATGDQYQWDYADRLTQTTKNGQTARYIYDYQGQRVIKHSAGKTVFYISKDFEIRNDEWFKYVFAGNRLARIESAPPASEMGAAKTQAITLQPGWNYVALTVAPTDPSPHKVFEPVLDQIREVNGYEQSSGLYSTFTPWVQDNILQIKAHQGYLVYTYNAVTFSVSGTAVTAPTRFNPGWSLVALPLQSTTEAVESVLDRLSPKPNNVWGWNAAQNGWDFHLAGLPETLNTLQELEQSKPYWINIEEETTPQTTLRGKITFYHSDHLGGTNFITSELGEVMEEIGYYPYGRIRFSTSAGLHPDTAYSFTGKELDSESGLMYFEARYYDPVIGRFISVDPLFVEEPEGCGVHECNLYIYSHDNPLYFIDPSGLDDTENDGLSGFDSGYSEGTPGDNAGAFADGAASFFVPGYDLSKQLYTALGPGFSAEERRFAAGAAFAEMATLSLAPPAGIVSKLQLGSEGAGGAIGQVACFEAGTLVHTDSGLRPIESVRAGDLVWSKNDQTGDSRWKKVLRTSIKLSTIWELEVLTQSGHSEVLRTTAEHPFWVDGSGWKEVQSLKEKDLLTTSNGELVTITSVQKTEQNTQVYNFEVEEFHTYFVGRSGVWVHNSCGSLENGLRTASEAGISSANATRLQNAANRTQQRITVVGSRAGGTAKATSDWDYIMSGKSSQRHSARGSVPRGTQGGEINSIGRETGVDVFQDYNPNTPGYSPLQTSKPHVIFDPQ